MKEPQGVTGSLKQENDERCFGKPSLIFFNLLIFRERERERVGERKRERNIYA